MNLPAIQNQAIDYSNAKTLETIRNTVAVGATDAELEMFVAFCKSTGLNPFKKEIWFIKTVEKTFYSKKAGREITVPARVTMMTGVWGFYAIANEHPAYDGTEEVQYEIGPDGVPVLARTRTFRKDRTIPSVGVARWAEFFPGPTDNGKSIWETKPFLMLGKVAESISLRKAFPQKLNGLYTQEEMDHVEALEVGADAHVPHPLDAIPAPKQITAPPVSPVKSETGKQAATRLLMQTGQTWQYGAGLIEVEGPERKRLWASLVRDHGAITDEQGIIHTSTFADGLAYALIGEPKLDNVSSNGEEK